jgi:hypothetical protein
VRHQQHPDGCDHDGDEPNPRAKMLPLNGPASGTKNRRHQHGVNGDVAQAYGATDKELSQHCPTPNGDVAAIR